MCPGVADRALMLSESDQDISGAREEDSDLTEGVGGDFERNGNGGNLKPRGGVESGKWTLGRGGVEAGKWRLGKGGVDVGKWRLGRGGVEAGKWKLGRGGIEVGMGRLGRGAAGMMVFHLK